MRLLLRQPHLVLRTTNLTACIPFKSDISCGVQKKGIQEEGALIPINIVERTCSKVMWFFYRAMFPCIVINQGTYLCRPTTQTDCQEAHLSSFLDKHGTTLLLLTDATSESGYSISHTSFLILLRSAFVGSISKPRSSVTIHSAIFCFAFNAVARRK